MTLFQHVHRICFELSNACNYAAVHRKCPVNAFRTIKTLKTEIIESVIEAAYRGEFAGWVSFHVYNEPLIDPRLMDFIAIAHASHMLPFIMTNGWYLDQNILDDLIEAGAHKVSVTTYCDEEFDRIGNLNFRTLPHFVGRTDKLDDRLKIYTGPKIMEKFLPPCSQPLGELMIRHTGQVGLCCNDWDMKHVFGDLNTDTIENILGNPDLRRITNELENRCRRLDICQRCKGGRIAATIERGE